MHLLVFLVLHKEVYEWSVGVNTSEYEYQTFDMTFTDKIYDYFAGVGATDADGNLLRSSYRELSIWLCI